MRLSTSFGKILTGVMFPLVYTADLPSPGCNLLLEIERTNIGEYIYRANNELHLLGWPWGSLGEIYKRGSVANWLTNAGPNGKVLVIPKGRLASLSRDLVWVPGQNL